MTLALRPYQEAALAAVSDAEARGLRRVVVAQATGTGKTVVFAHLLGRRGGRSVVLAHRDELVRQAVDKIRQVNPSMRVGVVKAEEDDVAAPTVVASVQTLARPVRVERLLRAGAGNLFAPAEPLRTVVVDEMHHYVGGADGNTFGAVLAGLGCLNPAGPLTVGFTATPERGDDAQLGGFWEEIVFEFGILRGIRERYLAPIRAKQVKLAADFRRLKVRAGEFRDEEAAELLMEADAPKHAARAYLEHAKGRRAVVFTPTIAVAHAMADAFRAAGVTAEAVDGTMPMDQRRAILRRLSTGETMVCPNAQLLTEGWDEPSVSCAIMARPTRSRPFAIQMIGRVLRPYPGKEDALVLDLVGSVLRMDLVTVASLFDVDATDAEEGVLQAIARKEQRAAAAAKRAQGHLPVEDDAPDGRLVAVPVELFQGREVHWVESAGRFVLSLGSEGSIYLTQRGALWDVIQTHRYQLPQSGRWADARKVLAEGLALGYAQGVAEDFARKKAPALNDPRAGWRSAPATDAQRERLVKWRLWRPGMTKGEASDAITARIARRFA